MRGSTVGSCDGILVASVWFRNPLIFVNNAEDMKHDRV